MAARRAARGLLDDIAEVVGRHAQFVGAILHGGQAEALLEPILEIVAQQVVEADEDVGVLNLTGDELAVVETLAEVEHQLDIANEDGVLKLVRPLTQLVAHLMHQRGKDVVFLVGHVQGLVDAVIEEGILLDVLLERKTVQQVGMEKQSPSRQHHLLAVVLLAAYLPGSHADYRTLLVIILAAAVCQVYLRLVVEEDAVHAVIVQTMAHGRHLGIVYDADQGVLLFASEVATIIIDIPYFQYCAHAVCGQVLRTKINDFSKNGILCRLMVTAFPPVPP